MLVLCLSFAIAVLDQLTKHFVGLHLRFSDPVQMVPGLFNLSYVQNTGAAWGMLAGANNGLIVLSITMLAVILVYRRSLIGCSILHQVAMALMVGGILGNLADRIRLGYVVDFLDFHWSVHHFPAFNVADSAICVGVMTYAVSALVLRDGAEVSAASEKDDSVSG